MVVGDLFDYVAVRIDEFVVAWLFVLWKGNSTVGLYMIDGLVFEWLLRYIFCINMARLIIQIFRIVYN